MLSQIVIRKYSYLDGRAGEPARPFAPAKYCKSKGTKSFVENVRDKTHTAMHYHTFIHPGLEDQTVVPADVPRVIPSQVNSFFIVDNSIMIG